MEQPLYDSDTELESFGSEVKSQPESSKPPSTLRRSAFFLSLTIGLSGLQAIFALIFSSGTAYLSSLGISGSALSLVWSSGPICGLIVQPFFGIASDHCQSSWGRRKPFIFFGALGAIASLLIMAWAETLGNGIATMLPLLSRHAEKQTALPASLAVFCTITLNISIQALQGGLRALVVDTVPPEEQQTVTAWAAMLISLTNVLCYGLSLADLRQDQSGSQFAILCVFTSVLLTATVSITLLTVREKRDFMLELGASGGGAPRIGLVSMLRDLYNGFFRLAPRLRTVMMAQFFSFLGWFPFLYYVATYLGNLDKKNHLSQPASGAIRSTQQTGSLGLLIFSTVSVVAGIIIPRFTASRAASESSSGINAPNGGKAIRQAWAASQILFATAMILTILVSSSDKAYFLIGLSGISWAVTIWAPFAIIGAHVSADIAATKLGLAAGRSEVRCGIVVGLHNAAMSAPQIASAILCSFLFWILNGVSEDIVGWALRLTALSTLAAARLIAKLDDE